MSFHDLWDSVEKLSRLIVLANWGIASTLLVAFACTAIAIKSSSRKDELTGAEELKKVAQIAHLENSNLILRSQVASLEKDASDAKTAQQNVEIELGKQQVLVGEANARAEELKKQNLTTESRLAAEQDKRLEMEKSLAPRRIPFQMGGPGDPTSFDSLKPFAGINTTIEYLPDAEAARAADEISQILSLAGWKITNVVPRTDINMAYFDGVLVERPRPLVSGRFPLPPEELEADTKPGVASDALVAFLKSNDWEARGNWAIDKNMPKGTIKVIVGFKPNPYFAPEWVKELKKRENRP